MKWPLLVRGLWGLGDNLYSRPFLRAAVAKYDIWLDTPWPELYEDIGGLRFVRGNRRLRTQNKNIARQDARRWSLPPRLIREVTIFYGRDLGTMSIVASLERRWRMLGVSFDPALLNLPQQLGPGPALPRPYAVVRPVTERAEWHNSARGPRPEYIAAIAAALMATHTVVAVADIEDGQEWLVGEMPPAHRHWVRGELGVRELLALVRDADVVVGGVGWIVPAALATGTRTFCVLGGQGGHNGPEKITDPRLDCSRLGFAMPENYCRCTSMTHSCDKTISDVLGQFGRWSSSLQRAA